MYYFTDIEYKYAVDNEAERKLAINIDMTVAMQCPLIGADVLDIWGRDLGNCLSLISYIPCLCYSLQFNTLVSSSLPEAQKCRTH